MGRGLRAMCDAVRCGGDTEHAPPAGTTVQVAAATVFILGTAADMTGIGAPVGIFSQGSAAIGAAIGTVARGAGTLGKAAGLCN